MAAVTSWPKAGSVSANSAIPTSKTQAKNHTFFITEPPHALKFLGRPQRTHITNGHMLYSSSVCKVKKKISIFLSNSSNTCERKLYSTSVSAKKHLSVR